MAVGVVVSDQSAELDVVGEVGRFPLRTEQDGADDRSVLFDEQPQRQRVVDVGDRVQ